MWEPRHTRKPMLLLRLSGGLLLRLAARQFLGLLFHDPPRSTRDRSQAAPQAEACECSMVARRGGRKKICGAAARRPVDQRCGGPVSSGAVASGSMGEPRHTRKPKLMTRTTGGKS